MLRWLWLPLVILIKLLVPLGFLIIAIGVFSELMGPGEFLILGLVIVGILIGLAKVDWDDLEESDGVPDQYEVDDQGTVYDENGNAIGVDAGGGKENTSEK